MSFTQALIVLLFLLAIFVVPRDWFDRLDRTSRGLSRDLSHELARRPVFSAQVVNGKEAEFIRDRLPRRTPRWIWAAALLLFGAAIWLASRGA